MTPTSAQLQLSCDTCGQAIRTDEHGAIHVDLREARAATDALRAWEAREKRQEDLDNHWVADMLLLPAPASWRVECPRCCHDCTVCYSIDTRTCQTSWELLEWTVHLQDKNWLRGTNWFGLIGNLARTNGVHAGSRRQAA